MRTEGLLQRLWDGDLWDGRDADFRRGENCAGRMWLGWRGRVWADLVCRTTGHIFWRTGAIVYAEGSLPFNAVFCRRCFRGGHLVGDYAPQTARMVEAAVKDALAKSLPLPAPRKPSEPPVRSRGRRK